jgi:hypothetical protein
MHLHYEGIALLTLGIGLILGAKRITSWNVNYLMRQLRRVEARAHSNRWDSAFAKFNAGMLRGQIAAWEGLGGTPTVITMGVVMVIMGYVILHDRL